MGEAEQQVPRQQVQRMCARGLPTTSPGSHCGRDYASNVGDGGGKEASDDVFEKVPNTD